MAQVDEERKQNDLQRTGTNGKRNRMNLFIFVCCPATLLFITIYDKEEAHWKHEELELNRTNFNKNTTLDLKHSC